MITDNLTIKVEGKANEYINSKIQDDAPDYVFGSVIFCRCVRRK